MKKILRLLTLAICLAVSVFTLEAKTYALVLGISNYGPKGKNLNHTTKDAKEFAALMKEQGAEVTLLTGSNVTSDILEKAILAICSQADADDRIVMFFTGHGADRGIILYDMGYSYELLAKQFMQARCQNKLVILDACCSGAIASSLKTNTGYPEGLVFLVGSRSDEASIEQGLIGSGYLGHAIMKGMRGLADKDSDRNITLEELFKYTYNDVVKHSNKRQHPQLIGPKSEYNKIVARW